MLNNNICKFFMIIMAVVLSLNCINSQSEAKAFTPLKNADFMNAVKEKHIMWINERREAGSEFPIMIFREVYDYSLLYRYKFECFINEKEKTTVSSLAGNNGTYDVEIVCGGGYSWSYLCATNAIFSVIGIDPKEFSANKEKYKHVLYEELQKGGYEYLIKRNDGSLLKIEEYIDTTDKAFLEHTNCKMIITCPE